MRRINTIVLHHTAGRQGGAEIRRQHIRRGWSDIFYHFVIEQDGRIFNGRPLNRAASNSRRTAIEIAVVGKLHQNPIRYAQANTLKTLIRDLRLDYPQITIFRNHRDVAATICPGHLHINDYL